MTTRTTWRTCWIGSDRGSTTDLTLQMREGVQHEGDRGKMTNPELLEMILDACL